jgi:heptosyltransferase-3
MKDILVWHQGAIGDLILSLAAVYSIKKHFPERSLHLIARDDLSDIVIGSGLADQMSSNEKGLYADFFSDAGISGRAADFIGNFEAAFVFMRRRHVTFMKNIGRYVPSCVHIATVPPEGVREHVSFFQGKQLKGRGVDLSMPPRLALPRRLPEIGAGAPTISVHPGSGGKEKRWGLRGFLDLIEILAEGGRYRFSILLGPAEAELKDECRRFVSEKNIPAEIVFGKPLTFIVSVLAASSLYVGNDSGITHLASALGRPSVAIFGPTDPSVWGPLGSNVRIIKPDIPFSVCQGTVKAEDVAGLARELLSEHAAHGSS